MNNAVIDLKTVGNKMLILNGTAENMLVRDEQVKGARHGFNMFVKHDDLTSQLNDIEKYLVDRGWDNIEITNNGIIENIEDISHSVLIEAFKKAQNEGLAVVINNNAMQWDALKEEA